MKAPETIAISGDTKIPIVHLKRPDKLNAISQQMIDELSVVFRDFEESFAHGREPRACVLMGWGEKAFVAGADLAQMAGMNSAAAERFSETGHVLGTLMEGASFPIVAAVNGFALGGGLELALCADFMFASEKARLGLPETTLGLIPGFGGTVRLAERVGLGRARELIYSGRVLDAEEAARIGLVNGVLPHESLLEKVLELCHRFANAAPLAVAKTKQLLSADGEGTRARAFGRETRAFGGLFATSDAQEGMLAFSAKRPAAFTGS